MYQQERLSKIMKLLKEKEVLSSQELMKVFEISRDTARRDIVKLSEQGAVIRTHGGIALPEINSIIEKYKGRQQLNASAKRKIGRKAAELIKEDQIYFLDVSTTVLFLCENIKVPSVVYTNSMDNLNLLVDKENIEVCAVGGNTNCRNRFFYGSEAREQLLKIHFDTAFLGAASISEDGVYYEEKEDADVKRIAAARAGRVVVLADSTKFQKKSRYQALPLEMIDILITDREPDLLWKRRLLENHIKMIKVEGR